MGVLPFLFSMKNIIFDLGNVIIDIDFSRTFKALAALSNNLSWEDGERIVKEKQLWVNYEKGLLSDQQFRDALRQELNIIATDEQIDVAFNALLLDIDPRRIELLKRLRKKYKIFVLSNTSHIHIIDVEKILFRCTGEKHLADLFDHLFLSYEMGKVKPHVDIYEAVLAQAGIEAHETLFLDDMLVNLEGAATLGIQVKQIIPNEFTILDLFADEA